MLSFQKNVVECDRNGKTAGKARKRLLNVAEINSNTGHGDGGYAIPISHRAYSNGLKGQHISGIS